MNLPNKLTLFRIILIPFLVVASYIKPLQEIIIFQSADLTLANLLVLIIFCLAAFTDFLDGYLARKNNLITTFGKFMDPLADKLLVLAALIILLESKEIPGWVVIIILAREFLVTGIRLIAVSEQKVIAASKLGKLKTISQMVMIIVLLLNNYPFSLINIPMNYIFIYLACFLTLISGIDYFIKNKNIILEYK